ncbi:hypothetical protein EZV62_016374 [Acer yangbiense]|uniref:Auxin efflux carrier component n=1 Tax=Acer yangbiense TaxID=1000413 RepID=A0A5C7HP56_9ROSI|nr:hypothetical protein EZV62_016374 [Acer yangbiense]
MISLADVYHVVAATVPLYVAMMLAYFSVKWWKLFTPDQCSGINKFVAKFSIPLLSFQVISNNNPYKMNLKLIYSDFLQKLLAFLVLAAITRFSSRGGLKWIITGISLSTLPNTLILGIPLLRAMYGDEAGVLIAQIVVLQSLIWYNLLLFLFELSAAKAASVTPQVEASGMYAFIVILFSVLLIESTLVSIRLLKWDQNKLQVSLQFFFFLNISPVKFCLKFLWGIKLPAIIDKSILILSNGGLGMAMFSLGLFMASRPSIIACGTRMAVVAMAMKFVTGPALMAASSVAVGLRGKLLRVAVVQATLPQGIVPFVFAKEYNVHPDGSVWLAHSLANSNSLLLHVGTMNCYCGELSVYAAELIKKQ